MFKKYLAEFYDTSGDMERLCYKVLTSIEGGKVKRVQEIFKWLVIAELELAVDDLKTAVEWSLKDKLLQFKKFLEVDCGAPLHLIPVERKNHGQLIHETLHSFLVMRRVALRHSMPMKGLPICTL